MLKARQKNIIEVNLSCTHCDEPVVRPIYDLSQTNVFCCHGCKTVFDVMHNKGLTDYYEIKQRAGSYKRRAPVNFRASKYDYLDDVDFKHEYSYKNSNEYQTMEFYLEGIHCLACLWLIEKLPTLMPDIVNSKLDLEKSTATICITENGKFSDVAKELNQLGYRPHPLKRNQESRDLKTSEDRSALLKIGVAAAGTSNIMLYAVSIYAGASESYAQYFNILTVLFGLPVLTYSASSFYKNAYTAIRNRQVSIDIPIATALVLGLVLGIKNLILGLNENYFDSLTMLVFLLLLSRYFLKKIQESALSANDLQYFYQGDSAHRAVDKNHDRFEEVHPKYVNKRDILKIYPNEIIPADGKVIAGKSLINTSLLTGESLPLEVKLKESVYAGTQNLTGELIIEVDSAGSDTKLGEILKSVESGWSTKAPIVELADEVAKYFILAVTVLSIVLFIYNINNTSIKEALEQTLTLLIVTCPCALALATPLAFTQTLSKCSNIGIIIKNDSIIQKISTLKNLFFDKTGTLTYGKLSITNFHQVRKTKLNIWDIITSLENKAVHPVGKALKEYAQDQGGSLIEHSSNIEIIGRGVKANISGEQYEINQKGIFENDSLVATFSYRDIVRSDSRTSLNLISTQGFKIKLLSGDNKSNVRAIANDLNLKEEQYFWELTPEQKKEIIMDTKYSMMVGDGANDAIALSRADIGVAVYGAMDISLRAADVFLVSPGIKPIAKLITISKETMKLIKRNLIISLVYNGLSVVAVFMGLINPLSAAIIMPLSSITVLLSTLVGTKKMRHAWKS